jgi:hypothetical protein
MDGRETRPMTKPGPSPEYRELLDGRITPDQYVEKIKKQVERLKRERAAAPPDRRAAASG